MKRAPAVLNAIADKVLAYRPKPKSKPARKRRRAKRKLDKATRGGPTEDDPERPYCKPDQSCCDFCCGN